MTYPPRDRARDESYVELSPGDPDYDLSEEAGYGDWEPRGRFEWAKWLIVALCVLLVASLVLPLLLRTS
jgi:hypothetical protein